MKNFSSKILKVIKWVGIGLICIILLNILNNIVDSSIYNANRTMSTINSYYSEEQDMALIMESTKADMYSASVSGGLSNAIDGIADIGKNYKTDSAVDSSVPQWENSTEVTSSENSGEKLVYEANATFETKDINSAVDFVHSVIEQSNGIIQNEKIDNLGKGSYYQPQAKIYVRIPQMSYTSFLTALQKEEGGLSLQSIDKNVENMTETYLDIESRLRSLRTQEARLLEFMKSAKTVAEMLEIESQLSDVQYEIEKYTNSKQGIDYDVKYSKITINILGVREYSETPVEKKNFFERVWSYIKGSAIGFGETLEGMLEYVIYLIPNLLLLFLFFMFGKFIVKVVRKKVKKNKKEVKEEVIIEEKTEEKTEENSEKIE